MSSDRRADVLRVAAALFQVRGYQGTSMDDIARGVGLNKGTLYHHVANKAAILFGIYREAQERALESIAAIAADAPPEVAVAEIIHLHLRSVARSPNETAVYFQEMQWIEEWLDERQVETIRRNERAYLDYAADTVQRGIDDGTFAPTDASVVAAGFVGLTAWTSQWFDPDGPYDVTAVADAFVSLVIDGLCARTGSSA